MANTKTTIELNGTVYDANTGRVLSVPQVSPGAASKPVAVKAPATPASNRTMDGFFAKPGSVTRPSQPAKLHVTEAKPASHRTTTKAAHKSRQPAKSQTLMRHVVKKPTLSTPAGKSSPVEPKPQPKLPTAHHSQRHERAMSTPQSSSISRFGARPVQAVEKQIAHLPVQAPPTEHHQAVHHAQTAIKAAEPASAVSFTAALQQADTHQKAKLKKPKVRERTARKLGMTTRLLTAGSVSLAVLLLVGFVAYQNVPNFAMRTAATRAGFNASMPDYTPSGFAMDGPILASPGHVTVNFRSASDERNYQVSQQPSNWTSESLLTNHVATNNQSFQTYQEKGKTIYINGSTATWVDGGVWYEVTGDSSLNTEQLLQIANSF